MILVWTCLFAALGGFLFGYDLGLIGGALLQIERYFHVGSSALLELIVGAAKLGAAVGTFLGGAAMARYGRQRALALNSIAFAGGPVIMAVATAPWMLVLGRFVIGIGIGISSTVSPAYIAELAPAPIRGSLVQLYEVMLCIGMLSAPLVDWVLSRADPDSSWRIMVGIPAIPALALAAAPFLLPESPRWLVTRNRLDEALRVLTTVMRGSGRLARRTDVPWSTGYTRITDKDAGGRSPAALADDQAVKDAEDELLQLWSGVELDRSAVLEQRRKLWRSRQLSSGGRQWGRLGRWTGVLGRRKLPSLDPIPEEPNSQMSSPCCSVGKSAGGGGGGAGGGGWSGGPWSRANGEEDGGGGLRRGLRSGLELGSGNRHGPGPAAAAAAAGGGGGAGAGDEEKGGGEAVVSGVGGGCGYGAAAATSGNALGKLRTGGSVRSDGWGLVEPTSRQADGAGGGSSINGSSVSGDSSNGSGINVNCCSSPSSLIAGRGPDREPSGAPRGGSGGAACSSSSGTGVRTSGRHHPEAYLPLPASGPSGSCGREPGERDRLLAPAACGGTGGGSASEPGGEPDLTGAPASLAVMPGEEATYFHTLGALLADIGALAGGPERRALFLALGLAFFDQITASTAIINYAPRLLLHMGEGSGGGEGEGVVDDGSAMLYTTAVAGAKAVGVVTALLLVDRFGRRPLLIAGSLACSAALGALTAAAVAGSAAAVGAAMCAFTLFFSLSWAGLYWVVVSELFSMSAKSAATSAATGLLFLTGAATNLVFLTLEDLLGPLVFVLLAALCLASAAYVALLLPETKGKTLAEVQRMLAGGEGGGWRAGAGPGPGAGSGQWVELRERPGS